MVTHGYRRFADLDHRAAREFAAQLRTRRGRHGQLTPSALRHHLTLLAALYEHRDELPDAPLVHPLDGDTETAFAGERGRDGVPIPHIPDDIATHIIGQALTWVRTHARVILEAEHTVFGPKLTASANSPYLAVRLRRAAGRGLTLSSPIAWKGKMYEELRDLHLLERLREHLAYACYIVIASHTGMRASEIGAMQTDCLETATIDGGRLLLFVRSRLFKTATADDGAETRWVAGRDHSGNPVRLAVEALVELRRLHVDEASTAGLWAIAMGPRKGASRSNRNFSAWTNQFARTIGLRRAWTFSSHQFRKTFARWIVIHHKVDMLHCATISSM
jgi:integrase